MNPYGLSPLTAIIMNNAYVLSDIKVTIVPKIYKIDQQNKTVEQIWEYGKIVEMNGFLL